MSLLDRANKILLNKNKTLPKSKVGLINLDDYNFCIYRFLDHQGRILYLGKCTRSCNIDKRGRSRNYFLKDRLTQHFSPSSKQNPKSLYLNIAKIEVILPDVNNNEELEKLENSLISYYEREHLCCYYNKDISNPTYIDKDENEWIEYYSLTESDIRTLTSNYGYEEIPPIEITNERLRAMMWLKENKLKQLKEIEENER